MFVHKLGKDTELRLLGERHAEELADLTDRNREHLRAWLPWVDSNRTVEDHRTFIRGALEQFAGNNGFQAGICMKVAWRGWSVFTAWTERTAAPSWATGSARSSRAGGS